MTNDKSTLLIRADANSQMGTGHVMRCIALGQQWQGQYGAVRFVCKALPEPLQHRLRTEAFELEDVTSESGSPADASSLVQLARRHNAAGLVVDGYQFGAEYQAIVATARSALMVVDDYGHAQRYHADLILNHNAGADAGLYNHRQPETQLLLGPRYALLRREFLDRPSAERPFPELACNILVTLGGSDPENATARIISALKTTLDRCGRFRIIIGGQNPRADELESMAASDVRFECLRNVQNMAPHYEWADLAVAAGGSSNWEMCYFGLPRVILVIAENQRVVAQELARSECCVNLGWHEDLDDPAIATAVEALATSATARSAMSKKSRELVDGQGARRATQALQRVAAYTTRVGWDKRLTQQSAPKPKNGFRHRSHESRKPSAGPPESAFHLRNDASNCKTTHPNTCLCVRCAVPRMAPAFWWAGATCALGNRLLDAARFLKPTAHLMVRLSHPTRRLHRVGWDKRLTQQSAPEPKNGFRHRSHESRKPSRRPTRIRVPLTKRCIQLQDDASEHLPFASDARFLGWHPHSGGPALPVR